MRRLWAPALDKLLIELPEVAEFYEAKFRIAVVDLRSRFRKLPEVEQQQLRVLGDEVAASLSDVRFDKASGDLRARRHVSPVPAIDLALTQRATILIFARFASAW